MIRTSAFAVLAMLAPLAGAIVVPKGTEVLLVFKDPLSSKVAKAGDRVRLSVKQDVRVGGRTVLRAGAPVVGIVEQVDKKSRWGKNARIRFVLNPVRGIPLEPRDKGKPLSGSRTDKAAIASGAGMLLLGPLGLAGGYFVVGKPVNIKVGSTLRTEVSRSVNVP